MTNDVLRTQLDHVTRGIVGSDLHPDEKAKALTHVSRLYRACGDIEAVEDMDESL